MDQLELARENHQFLVVQVPNCMFGENFQEALYSANGLMEDIRAEQRPPRPEDFRHCGFETGFVGITAAAAEIILEQNIDVFALASALHCAFKPGADTGEVNDRITVSVAGVRFTFTITDYETEDSEGRWIDCTNDPLAVPSGQVMHRRVIIDLAPQ